MCMLQGSVGGVRGGGAGYQLPLLYVPRPAGDLRG